MDSTTITRPRHEGAARWRRPLLVACGVVAFAPVLLFLVGIPLHSAKPGTCDAWPGCDASAREQWLWTAQSWAVAGVALSAFVVTAMAVVPWLRARPKVLRRCAIVVLCLLVVVTALLVLLFLVILGTTCSDSAFLCFGGPGDAVGLTWPGVVTGGLALALGLGLHRPGTPLGTKLLTGVVTTVVGCVAAVVVSMPVGALLGWLGDLLAG